MRHIPPPPPPEGIDLVIEKILIDDEVIRRNRALQMEDRQNRNDLAKLADDLADIAGPERDHLGRVVVDWRYALVGAVVVAVVAGFAFWLVAMLLSTPPPAP